MKSFLLPLSYGLGLSADAFAVSLAKGLSVSRLKMKYQLHVGALFGFFQFLMPLLGWKCASFLQHRLEKFAPLLSCSILVLVGLHMIFEKKKEEKSAPYPFSVKLLLPLAFATSMDAFLSGITFAFHGFSLKKALFYSETIGIITFLFSFFGVKIGNLFGMKYQKKAEIFGGILLILLGIYSLF